MYVYTYTYIQVSTHLLHSAGISKDPSVEAPSIMKPGPGNGAVAPGPAVGSRWKQKNWHPAPGCASQALNGSLPKSVVPFTGSTWSIFTFYWRYLSYSWGRDTIVVHPLIKGTSWGHHGNIWGIQWWKKNVHINQQHRWLVEPAPRIILC